MTQDHATETRLAAIEAACLDMLDRLELLEFDAEEAAEKRAFDRVISQERTRPERRRIAADPAA